MSTYRLAAASLCLVFVATLSIPVDAQGPIRNRIRQRVQARVEAPQFTPYLERDRWVDVSEWFDGNNYNPTNEVVDRLTDQIERRNRLGANTTANFDYGRRDNWYGFETNSDANWFYDYYNHGYYFATDPKTDTGVQTSYRYYDTDNDGFYDAYATYIDRDRDGKYDDERFYTFDDETDANGNADTDDLKLDPALAKNDDLISLRQSISGTVTQTKQTRTPSAMHTVIVVKSDENAQQTTFVDIGPTTSGDSWSVKKGDKITAEGPVVGIGDKRLMLADKIEFEGESYVISQQQQAWDGVVVDTKKMDVRGQSQLMAIVYTPDKKRVLVDLGAADQSKFDLKQNDQIVVRGVPMKIDNRQVVRAHQIEHGGQTVIIQHSDANIEGINQR